mmetsp:Transcript_9449/g.23193  ORF Transcript_9449/g.23193 Transcript_9449/m.23193 type:complete len:201 (-) Transcript_9449:225-827(-)
MKRAESINSTASLAMDLAVSRSHDTTSNLATTPHMGLVLTTSQSIGRSVVFSTKMELQSVPSFSCSSTPIEVSVLHPPFSSESLAIRASYNPGCFDRKTNSRTRSTSGESFRTRNVEKSIDTRSRSEVFSTTTQTRARASHRCRKVFHTGLPLRFFRYPVPLTARKPSRLARSKVRRSSRFNRWQVNRLPVPLCFLAPLP